MEAYFGDLKKQITPLLNELVTAEEIVDTYTYLIESTMLCGTGTEVTTYGEQMVEKLKVLRNELTSDEDIIFVNKNLGNAELNLGNIQIAAVYYREVVEYKPTPRNIFQLASTYDLAGNHACAHYWYQELLAMEDADASIYKDFVGERVALIEEIYEGQDIPYCHD
jgi:tetratricopeptide (TPR) repeat protein